MAKVQLLRILNIIEPNQKLCAVIGDLAVKLNGIPVSDLGANGGKILAKERKFVLDFTLK